MKFFRQSSRLKKIIIFSLSGLIVISGLISLIIFKPNKAEANAITATNISISAVNTTTGKATIKFDVTWSNSFSTTYDGKAFWDKAWIFLKYSTQGGTSGSWNHATLTTGGTITPVADGKGAFVDSSANQTVIWDYQTDGVAINSHAKIKVGAIEMVYIPEGSYTYDAGGIGTSSYNNYGAGVEVLVDDAGDVPTGAVSGWPNGFDDFYMAKYEISQGQYTDFLNTVSDSQASSRYDATLYNTYGYTILYTSSAAYGAKYSTTTPNRGSNFISWDDAKAYLSWAGLRPMTEMEFEKAGRGTGNANTYPWGNTAPSTTTYTVDSGTHTKYYANYNNQSGAKPINVGHYLSADVTRTNAETGASPYGVADLAGNVWEHLINCQGTTTPLNGNGTITPPVSWPGAATGKGFRGGGWDNGSTYLRVSDRTYAGWSGAYRGSGVGLRAARAAE